MEYHVTRMSPCVRLLWLLVLYAHALKAVHICPAATECYCFYNREIDCLQFDLRKIPHFDPENLTFENIDLGQNRFREIEANAFKELRVKEINIWENRRNMTLDRDAFVGVGDYLEYLELAKNREITTIPQGLFRTTPKLVVIDMARNKLKYLPPFAFKGAVSLELLDLQKNDLAHLQDNVFRGLPSIQELILSDNNISAMSAKSFLGMKKLEELYLQRNRIRDLQPKAFRRLESLRILDLSNNDMSALFPLMFKGLRKLETLDLTNNPLELIADSAFSSMESLLELNINKAKLSHLRPGMFRGLKSLRELSLYHNHIYDLQDDLFRSLPSLWKLFLDNNQLNTLNPCAFDNISKLKSISVSGNRIHCDCAMSWASRDSTPEVIGQCASPDSEKKTDISNGERYNVCTFTGMECGNLPNQDTNEPLRLWLRYRRAYRHSPKMFNG